MRRKQLRARLEELERIQNAQYWAFTRQARGQPVQPAVTREIYAIKRQLGIDVG